LGAGKTRSQKNARLRSVPQIGRASLQRAAPRTSALALAISPVGYVLSRVKLNKECKDRTGWQGQSDDSTTEGINLPIILSSLQGENQKTKLLDYAKCVALSETLHRKVSCRSIISTRFPTNDWPGGEWHHSQFYSEDVQHDSK